MRSHKTGAVLVRENLILSNGWSHTPSFRLGNKQRSIHAEIHALARGRYKYLNGATMYIVTLSGKSGNWVNAMPCLDCAIALRAAGVFDVLHSISGGYKRLWLFDDSFFDKLKVYRNAECL